MNQQSLINFAQTVIDTELQAIEQLKSRINDAFIQACDLLLSVQGHVIVCGMGKSGHIGNKLAATLASTGTAAFFVHPSEASHGDLGMIKDRDVIILLSNSGNTVEITHLLPIIKHLGCPIISLVGEMDSDIAHASDVILDVSVAKEACPLGLAPTASTTATLVMGDALAIALLQARGFTNEDFARSHPGGRLGKRLLLKVKDLMHTNSAIPKLMLPANLGQALVEMTAKTLGMTTIINNQNQLLGIFTDGDLRRTLEQDNVDIKTLALDKIMTIHPKTIQAEALAINALTLMEENNITNLVVVNDENHVKGIINMHELLKAGVA